MISVARAFERDYFESVYRDYRSQNPDRKLDFYASLAERAVQARPEPRVLDIGCAFGLFLAHLDSRWRKAGIDPSEYAVDRCTRLLPDARIAVGTVETCPLSGPFDVITAFDVLEHVGDLQGSFDWAIRNLRTGGGLIFVVPVYDGPLGLLVRALDKDPTHVHKSSRRFWLELTSRYLQVVDWWGVFRYLLPGRRYVHWVSRPLRAFSPAIAVLARRE